jgi:putative transcriptional regulator
MRKRRERLRNLRLKRNLKQSEVAESVGMSCCYYGMIERGERTPILEDAKLLADFFNTTIDFLFFESVSYKTYSEQVDIPSGTEFQPL